MAPVAKYVKNGLSGVSDCWAPDPRDRLVRHVGREVVVRIVRRLDLDRAVEDQRRPLIGLAADEAVELVESGTRRPAIERSGHAHFPRRRLVILAESGGAVAVLAQDLGQRRDALRPCSGVARECRRDFHDRARVVRVVVAAGQQGHARRRAECRRVEAVVLEPLARETIERRHGNLAAERARVAEADVVDQKDDDVRRACRRLHLEPRRRLWHCVRRVRWRADSRAPRSGSDVRSISPDTVGWDVAVVCLNPSKATTAANMSAALNVAGMTCFRIMLPSLVLSACRLISFQRTNPPDPDLQDRTNGWLVGSMTMSRSSLVVVGQLVRNNNGSFVGRRWFVDRRRLIIVRRFSILTKLLQMKLT